MYNKDEQYDIKYINTNGEQITKKVTPQEDLSKPQMIMKLKEEDKNFFKLLEGKNLKEENKMERLDKCVMLEDVDETEREVPLGVVYTIKLNTSNVAFEENGERELKRVLDKLAEDIMQGDVEGKVLDFNGNVCLTYTSEEETFEESKKIEESAEGQKLADYLESTDYEDVDITDSEVDMMVAFCLDIENADTDSFETYLSVLAKDLNVMNVGNGIITVDLTRHVTDNFDLYDSILDCDGVSKEEEITEIVENMSGLISGYATDSVYTELVKGLSR